MIPLLASRVPYLELDGGIIQRDCLRQEGRSNRRLLVLKKLTPDEAEHKAGLSHRRVAQQDELELEHPPRRHRSASQEG